MNISELNAGQGNVEVVGTITEASEPRVFSKFGKELIVVNSVLKDDSGSIKLTLWNDDAKMFNEGDKVQIINGYVNEYQGEKQLTPGKFGKIQLAELAEKKEAVEESGDDSEEVEEEVI